MTVARILEKYSDVKQVRLDPRSHTVHLGFYRLPSSSILSEIETAVLRDLSGEWYIKVQPPQISSAFHQHLTGDGQPSSIASIQSTNRKLFGNEFYSDMAESPRSATQCSRLPHHALTGRRLRH